MALDLGQRLAARLSQLQNLFARRENVLGVFGSRVDGYILWEDLMGLREEIRQGRLSLLSHEEVFGR